MKPTMIAAIGLALLAIGPFAGADDAAYTLQKDVIYGRKYGMSLTMDVLTPTKNANAAGIVVVASGAWVSTPDWSGTLAKGVGQTFAGRGYTIFIVYHGCQPKFNIQEIKQDLNRSVRYIRSRAPDFQIDPDRLGIMGFSSGGHLALLQAMGGDAGDPEAKDPIDRFSSRIRAACVGAPPTDFLNYGKPGENALGRGILAGYRPAFDFYEFDEKEHANMRITDEQRLLEIGREVSPIYHVTADDPPTFIIHGDKDTAVPIQQAESLLARLDEVGVPTKLLVKKGAGHFWREPGKDWPEQADWFDKHLLKK
jgi:acetyl esterase/lipase